MALRAQFWRGQELRQSRWWRPILIIGLVIAWLGEARAQPANRADAEASIRWREGVTAFASGKYETARVAFLQAYSIRPDPALLQNLGEAELRTGHYVEAANHLREFLQREQEKSEQRAKAAASLESALNHVGRLVIELAVLAPTLTIDGQPLAETPSDSHPLILAAGAHVVAVSKSGYRDIERTIDLREGVVTRANFELESASSAAPAPSATPREPSPMTLDNGRTESAPKSASSRIETRTVVVAAGAGVTAVAIGTGIYFAVKLSSEENRIDELRGLLAPYDTGGAQACYRPTTAVTSWCSELSSRNDARRVDISGERVAFISGAVVGVATLTAFFVWPRRPASGLSFQAMPQWSRTGGGLVLVGQF